MNDYYPDFHDGTPQDEPFPSLDLRRERLQISSVALAITLITLVTLLFQVVSGVLIAILAPRLALQPWFTIVLSTAPMYLVAMPLSLLIYRWGEASPPAPRKINFAAWLALLTVTFAVTYVGSFIGNAVNTIIGMITGKPVENQLEILTQQTPFWANLLFIGILAPILEEIFYRKLVIDRLRRYGDLVAVLVSGILFGLLHGNFSQFFYACMCGILFGYVYLYTGKLRYTIALHTTVNLVGGVLISEVTKRLDLEVLQSGSIDALLQNLLPLSLLIGYIIFNFSCLILGPISIVLLRKHIRFQKGEIQLNAKSFFRIFFLNPVVWILLIFMLSGFLF